MSCISGVASGPPIWRKQMWCPPWRFAIAEPIAALHLAAGHGTRCSECLRSFHRVEHFTAPLAGVSGVLTRSGTTTVVTTTVPVEVRLAKATRLLRLRVARQVMRMVLAAHQPAAILRLPSVASAV